MLISQKESLHQEWGRAEQVYATFGIKRGSLYNLTAENKVWSKLKKLTGEKKGMRLWNMDSIREYIESPAEDLEEQKKSPPIDDSGEDDSGTVVQE